MDREKFLNACSEQVNWRVIVSIPPAVGYRAAPDEAIRIMGEIKRHVDGFSGLVVDYDRICKFCGAAWEVADGMKAIPDGRPLCCEKAGKMFDESALGTLER